MANVEQIYVIVNAAAKQAFGENAVTVTNTSTFVSLGDDILSSQTSLDAFNNALSDVIGRTVISIRMYSPDGDDMVRHGIDWGIALRKIYVDTGEAMENEAWNIGKEGYVPEFAPIYLPTVKQHLFSKMSTYSYGVTIPDNLWETAFHSETEMAILIDGIFTAMDNNLNVALENMANLTRATFIANKINAGDMHAINVLQEYNTTTANNLTVAQALRSADFLAWSNQLIGMFSDRLEKMSTMFNTAEYKRHTPKSMQVLRVLSNYDKASATFLEANTFHQELVKLPYYKPIPYWQGSGVEYDFNSCSTVSITLADGTEVTQSGIIAVLHDYQAIGITIDKPRTVSQRNNLAEYTDYVAKANRGWFCDMSENGVVFYMAEPTSPETPQVLKSVKK